MTEFESLYTQCFGDVYRYLLKLSGDPLLAEDLTSETFFKAMRAFDSFRGDCPQKIWLLRIAKNSFFSQMKRSRRSISLEEVPVEAVSDSAEPEKLLLIKSEAERALEAVKSLPESLREVFMWRHYGELGFREIGAAFGKSENWACVSYHRARKQLISKLEDENEHK